MWSVNIVTPSKNAPEMLMSIKVNKVSVTTAFDNVDENQQKFNYSFFNTLFGSPNLFEQNVSQSYYF